MFLRHDGSRLTGIRIDTLQLNYKLLCHRAHFAESLWVTQVQTASQGLSGVYLWTVASGEVGGDEHVAYIGRTRSLARRLSEYLGEFQPHSVNDHKLRVFQEHLLKKYPLGRFALHFKEVPASELVNEETEAVRFFCPLMNQKLVPPPTARQAFRDAFASYYLAGLAPFLPDDDS